LRKSDGGLLANRKKPRETPVRWRKRSENFDDCVKQGEFADCSCPSADADCNEKEQSIDSNGTDA
jgi:hypothetical protein